MDRIAERVVARCKKAWGDPESPEGQAVVNDPAWKKAEAQHEKALMMVYKAADIYGDAMADLLRVRGLPHKAADRIKDYAKLERWLKDKVSVWGDDMHILRRYVADHYDR